MTKDLLTDDEIAKIKLDGSKRDANWKIYIDQLLTEREHLLELLNPKAKRKED